MSFHWQDQSAWRTHLDQDGYVILTDVLDAHDIQKGLELFESYMDFPLENDGFMSHTTIHRSRFMWFARTHPRVLEIYASMYGVHSTDLVTAFDKANAVRNAPYGERDWAWPHVDYPINDPPSFACFQGMLHFIDCTAEDAPCLRVIPGSHTDARVLVDLRARFDSSNKSAFFDTLHDVKELVCVRPPAGALVLWNSKTVHDNYTYLKSKNRAYGRLRRLAAYLCYLPRSLCTLDELALRREIWSAGDASTHWPAHHVERIVPDAKRTKKRKTVWDPEEMAREFPRIKHLVPL